MLLDQIETVLPTGTNISKFAKNAFLSQELTKNLQYVVNVCACEVLYISVYRCNNCLYPPNQIQLHVLCACRVLGSVLIYH